MCRASWHWVVTVVVGSGKVTTGSSWHPAVTQVRRASSEGATVVLLEDYPHLTVPATEALVPVRPPQRQVTPQLSSAQGEDSQCWVA